MPFRVMLNPSCQYGNIVVDAQGTEVYNEAKLMFRIALKVREVLASHQGIEAYLSREAEDSPSTLAQEVELTNRLHCDCLVAFHSDCAPNLAHPVREDLDAGGGTWTFYRSLAGYELAKCVHEAQLAATRSVYPEVRDRSLATHWIRLKVLWDTRCPACLTEILFHSHRRERALLLDEHFQWTVARGLADGLLRYLEART